ncbi:Uncharacterized protein Rs2_18504 [Raphanus sativus]|uniref:Uncharacterized protein LOC108854212 isoform X2 n=1 Tax=Raphanus sativus TaxID=3726 RepID=A0A6J0NFD9_RAPSA|nr:uncharacterized protein LOC108854212 isoform X2 [Raphanus sativus]KAJ4904553.1 Uncharacterized protein Rs2_18504 [Raphanus sativus]
MEYLRSVWLYPNVEEITSIASCNQGLRASADGKRQGLRGIFWNFADKHPSLDHLDQIKSALANEGHRCEVSIKAYCEGKNRVRPCFEHGSFSLQNRVSRDDGTFLELDTMLADILVWALHNPAPSNLMVISKIISHETELLRLLCDLESKGYSIFIAHAEEATPPMLPPGSLEWHLDELLAGRKPISRANYSRHKINMIQNDISRWSHDNHTGIFWNVEDYPVPGGLHPNIFICCLMETLSTGIKSVIVYGKKRNIAFYDHLSCGCSFPVTFVPSGDKDEGLIRK